MLFEFWMEKTSGVMSTIKNVFKPSIPVVKKNISLIKPIDPSKSTINQNAFKKLRTGTIQNPFFQSGF